jgi:hypothetical protein
MATIGDHWPLGFYDGEGQPTRTSITGSTIVAANDFGDLGNLTLTNNIAFFMSPEISVGADQIILAYADQTVISPVPDGVTPDPAKITFWRSEDETEATALALANYVITILGGAGTDTVLDTALASLANTYGVWNSKNTVYEPFPAI